MRVLFGLLVPGAIAAQVSMKGQGTLRGVAYDSLATTPLAGAEVWVRGTGQRAITDSSGYFRFDGLGEGRYVLVLAHAALEAVGMDHLAVAVTIETGRVATALLATPSRGTIWARRCAPRGVVEGDSGIIMMGVVTEEGTGRPRAGAIVEFNAAARSLQAVTDSIGWYYACGLSPDALVQVRRRVRVFGPGDTTLAIQVRTGAKAVARRDFAVGPAPAR